ncbi:uncharacterized protein [Nicotiana tomentosiformis]|uniref:uncharacterized protein n=1 Tax=Nicotiana tomentosiformis TaxID=4098 RepID=UPI00388C4074
MDSDSSPGPDGFTAKFFQSCCRNSLMMLMEELSVYEKYVGRKKISIFSKIITRILNKISRWHSKFLSSGGRAALIRHAILALPTHLLAVIHPPKGVLNQIERMLTGCFWGGSAKKKRHHWLPGITCVFHMRKGVPISGNLMKSAMHSLQSSGGTLELSQSWNEMCKIKKLVDKQILWKIGCGKIWRARCSAKYDSIRTNVRRTVSLIAFSMPQLAGLQFQQIQLGPNFEEISHLLRSTIHFDKSIIVKWIKPKSSYVKLNSDGSCKEGKCGAGGVIRDKEGFLVFAYSLVLVSGISNWAEAAALHYGIK